MRWFSEFWKANDDYEHHFDHNSDNKKEEKKSSSVKEIELPAGIAGLAVKYDEDIILPPKEKDFDDHPRFAIIQGYISGDSEALWRIGVLEADNMLEEVLTEKGYFGNDVAEKLTNAKFNTVQLAWDAHKVRNLIAHKGSNYTLTEREAKRVFVLYEAVFRELKAIH